MRLSRAVPDAPPPGTLALPADASLPRVDVLLAYQGAAGDLIDARRLPTARAALYLAGAGAGALTPSQSDAARRVVARGRSRRRRLAHGSGPRRGPECAERTPLISAGDLAPVKARVLLTLALAHDMDTRAIVALFAAPPTQAR